MSKIVKGLLGVAKELVGCGRYAWRRVGFKYQDVGHGTGALLWWVGRDGKMKTFKSTGRETHHELDPKLDMDRTWRGRLEPSSGRTTILPPLSVYANPRNGPDEVPVPDSLIRRLRQLGADVIYVDTQYGMGRVSKKTR